MIKLLFIRHGQSANNALPESQRVPDPGLTPLGQLQAENLAQYLRQDPPTHLYCSAFRRALETTLPTAKLLGITPEVRWELFEQGGCYDGYVRGKTKPSAGMGRQEIRSRFGDWHIDPLISDLGWYHGHPLETDEMAIQRAQRVARWINHEVKPQIVTQAKPAKLAFVIHADFKILLLEAMMHSACTSSRSSFSKFCQLGQEPWNTSISELEWQAEHWQLKSINQIPHLNATAEAS